MVMALDLRLEIAGSIPADALSSATLDKLLTKQYDLVKLGSKQAHRATHWPRVHGLAALAGARLRGIESELSTNLWAK